MTVDILYTQERQEREPIEVDYQLILWERARGETESRMRRGEGDTIDFIKREAKG